MSVARVNLNGNDQQFVASNQYTLVPWSGVALNENSLWTTQGMVPPAGNVNFDWQVWVNAGYGGTNPSMVAKLIKNASWDANHHLISGIDVTAAIGGSNDQSGTASCGASVNDTANGTDTYNLFLYATASNPAVGSTIDGNPAHTWLSARV